MQLNLLKWVRFEEMGHTSENGLIFLKNRSQLSNQ